MLFTGPLRGKGTRAGFALVHCMELGVLCGGDMDKESVSLDCLIFRSRIWLTKASPPCSRASDCFGRPLALCSLVLSLCSLSSPCTSSPARPQPLGAPLLLVSAISVSQLYATTDMEPLSAPCCKKKLYWLPPTTPSRCACDSFLTRSSSSRRSFIYSQKILFGPSLLCCYPFKPGPLSLWGKNEPQHSFSMT